MGKKNITINGRPLSVKDGMTILEAAQENEIDIPTLCHRPELTPTGACRICVVEVEGYRTLVGSCHTPIAEGMVIHTHSDKVLETRRLIVELLLANHCGSCYMCEKANICELRQIAADLEVGLPRFQAEKRYYPIDDSNPFIERDLTKCILCGRCIRACQELAVVGAIDYAYRGFESKPATSFDRPLAESPCEFCGLCVLMCPVGALSNKLSKNREKGTEKVRTICPYCGCGCGIYLNVRDQEVISVTPDTENSINNVCLCVKGHYGYDFVNSPDRLKAPLIRKNGELSESSWEEALDFVASRLGELKKKYGSDSLAGLSSSKCTNEENYLMQKFMRAVIGTNNIDNCARLCHAPTVTGLGLAFGSGAMTNSIEEIENADAILVIGSNTTEEHPIISHKIKRAVKWKGAKLIVADPRRIKLTEFAEVWLRLKPGSDVALINGLMNVIISEELWEKEFVRQRTEGFEEMRAGIEKYTPEYVEKVSGVPAADIVQAARLYARADRASIIYAMGITQHTTGTDNVLSLANLAMLTGNVGKESTGVNPLRGHNNVQGACDMGALPNVLPGYQGLDVASVREKFEKEWQVKLPEKAGLSVVEMLQAAEEGKVRGMYIMGENPALSEPDVSQVIEALKSLDFLVVQDIFLSETAKLADVVLPAVSFAEKDGTFTNTERRVQRVRKAIEPIGLAKPDWQIIAELATKMGYAMAYQTPEQIMQEIARLVPSYGGISYDRIEDGGLQWPCPDKAHPGTKFLHSDKFTRGRGKFNPIEYKAPAELPDKEYPFLLTTGRILYHFHTGTMTRRARGLNEMCPEGFVEINPDDAERLRVLGGGMVRMVSRRGAVVTKARVTETVPPGIVFMPFHFGEAAANMLTNPAFDPVSKIPELKVCAVRVEKA
jgi:formate dehydrogenase alpha subunit